MEDFEDFFIQGPAFELEFSPIDQVTPPVYSRRVLIFSNQNLDRDETISSLKAGLQRTVDEIPLLAGQMGLSPSGFWTIQKGVARLRVKDVDLSFSELEASEFSETLLSADVLSSVPGFADPQTEWHSCRLQANFVKGGLLLVLSVHHTTMDGYGISKVIAALARNCRKDFTSELQPPNILSRLIPAKEGVVGDVRKLAAYSIVPEGTQFPPITADIVTKTFRMSDSSLKQLKTDASPAEGWITTHDALNALCWKTHAKARYNHKMITDENIARFAFPVEFRRFLNPPLSSDYLGNAVLMTKVDLPVPTLVGKDGLSQAASTIREGVKQIDAEHVENFVALATSLERPRQFKINMKLESPETAFGSTSYKSFAHGSLNWDTVLGKFERMRLPYGVLGEGMTIILPVLSDGSWEVTITLERELLDTSETDKEWKKYVL